MILKATNQPSSFRRVRETLWQNSRARLWGFAAILFLISVCGAFILGAYLYKSGYLSETAKPAILRNIVYLPKKVHAFFSQPEVEHITIDIKHTEYMKLAYSREIALARGVLFTSDEDYVNGKIRYNGKTYRVDLRLKGDEPDHFSGDKWSLRVKVDGDNTLFGMKRFSIQHPGTRNFIYEWLLHQALKRENLIYHRYQFVKVTLNGKDKGIYALEEHIDKQLIEHNQRRDGPILRFNEALTWEELVHQIYDFQNAAWNGNGAYTASEIEAYQATKWAVDSLGSGYVKKAVSLLESFRRGNLATSEVFEVDKLATYFAVMDLLGANNGTQWANIRFYYNPVTSRLEPIGRDGSCCPLTKISAMMANIATQLDEYNRVLYYQIFSDTLFLAKYYAELERVSQPAYLDDFFAAIDQDLERNLLILYSEFSDFAFSKDLIYQNQRYIRTVLNPVKGFHAYFNNFHQNQITVDLGNIQALPVKVINASYRDSLIFPVVWKTVLPPFVVSQPVVFQQVNFQLPENFAWVDSLVKDVKINYQLPGTVRLRQELVLPPREFEGKFVGHDLFRQQPNAQTFDFFIINAAAKEIIIKPGSWDVNKTMIVPGGYRVICGPGTRLNLADASMILSYSPLEFTGSEDLPIVIHSEDSTGQGLVVLSAGGPSVLEYVTFNNLSNPAQQGWELTGAVTFYESDVQISHCQFIENRSEDGLNLIRSEFGIANSLFSGTSSDAFDADFCKGRITATSFINCGNDGIDVSGSVIEIERVFINGSGDKGLSNGEHSEMAVSDVEIQNAEIAVASKDISLITLTKVNITGGQIGLTAYQKKPEFGPGVIEARELRIKNVPIPYLVEERSRVTVDEKLIPPSRDNVKDILYGVEYGKASK